MPFSNIWLSEFVTDYIPTASSYYTTGMAQFKVPTEPPMSKALLSPGTVESISLMYGCLIGGS